MEQVWTVWVSTNTGTIQRTGNTLTIWEQVMVSNWFRGIVVRPTPSLVPGRCHSSFAERLDAATRGSPCPCLRPRHPRTMERGKIIDVDYLSLKADSISLGKYSGGWMVGLKERGNHNVPYLSFNREIFPYNFCISIIKASTKLSCDCAETKAGQITLRLRSSRSHGLRYSRSNMRAASGSSMICSFFASQQILRPILREILAK